mgnify:CR=1 FL=1
MTQRFFIKGCLPNLNDMLAASRKSRGKWNAFNDMKQAQTLSIVSCIRKAKLKAVARPVSVCFIWGEENKRLDVDNVAAAKKFVLDALVTAGILSNDGWAQVVGFTDNFTLKTGGSPPGVMVEICEV